MKVKNLINRVFNNKTIRNGGLFSIFAFFEQGCGFVLLIILARYINPGEYGELSLINTVITLLGFVIALSTQGYVSVSFFRKSREQFHKDFSSIIAIVLFMLLIFSIALLLFPNTLSSLAQIDIRYLWIALCISVTSVFSSIMFNYFRIREKVLKYGLASSSIAIANFVFSLLLVISFGMGWKGRIYTQLLCGLIIFVVSIVVFSSNKLFTFNIEWKDIKTILIWGIPLIPHLATNWIRQGCDRYIINSHYGLDEVGLFSFALNLTNVIAIVGFAFNSSFSVTIYQTLSDDKIDKNAKLKKLSLLIIAVYLGVTVLTLIGGTILCPLLLPKYTGSLPYFWILALFGLLQCLYYIYCNYLFYYGKTKNLMYITFSTAIVHLLLSLFLTKYSLFFTCIIYVFIQLMLVVLVRRRSRIILQEHSIKLL